MTRTTAILLKLKLKYNYHSEMNKNITFIVFNTEIGIQVLKKGLIEKPMKPVLRTTDFLLKSTNWLNKILYGLHLILNARHITTYRRVIFCKVIVLIK